MTCKDGVMQERLQALEWLSTLLAGFGTVALGLASEGESASKPDAAKAKELSLARAGLVLGGLLILVAMAAVLRARAQPRRASVSGGVSSQRAVSSSFGLQVPPPPPLPPPPSSPTHQTQKLHEPSGKQSDLFFQDISCKTSCSTAAALLGTPALLPEHCCIPTQQPLKTIAFSLGTNGIVVNRSDCSSCIKTPTRGTFLQCRICMRIKAVRFGPAAGHSHAGACFRLSVAACRTDF